MTLNKWYNFNKYVFEGDINFHVYSIYGKKIGSFYAEDIDATASSVLGAFEVTKVSINVEFECLDVELKEPTIHDGCESCVHFDPEETCDACRKCNGTAIPDSAEHNHKPDMFTEITDYSKHEAQR